MAGRTGRRREEGGWEASNRVTSEAGQRGVPRSDGNAVVAGR